MRKWACTTDAGSPGQHAQVLAELIPALGRADFGASLLDAMQPLVPAASFSIYQIGRGCVPRLHASGSRGVPDTTQDCWRAYLSGPIQEDRTLVDSVDRSPGPQLCHITASEVTGSHRQRVYEAHGVAERVSVVQGAPDQVFAVNFYRHQHQSPFSDAQVSGFESLAPALLALARKQVELRAPRLSVREQLQALQPGLTARELDVCERLCRGITYDGIAADLSLSVPSVKTYRNRAFDRLGIHFRNELNALLQQQLSH
jgi:DNA-binding CsgD family transcriptional regulator